MSLEFDGSTRVATRPTRADEPPAAAGQLRITRCPDVHQVGRVYPLRGEDITLGRDHSNVVALNDRDVSRHHARIVASDGAHRLIDQQSTNGTMVNGERVAAERLLRTGDVILLGSTALTYERT